MSIGTISLSLKPARVCPILWFVFSVALLLNMAVTPVTASVVARARSDLNGDGVVNMSDLAIMAVAFGSYPGHAQWDPRADVSDDDLVDMFDLLLVVKDYNTPAYTAEGRLWSADSYWYMKIKDNPKLHPNNDQMVDWLFDAHGQTYPYVSWHSWTGVIYDAYEDTPLYSVLEEDTGRYHQIPFPDPYPIDIPTDSDHSVSIIDWDRGHIWHLWNTRATGGTYIAGDLCQFELYGSGVENVGGGWTVGGSGCPRVAYIIRPEEIEAGVINHPLAFAARATGPWPGGSRFDSNSGFVHPPAVHTDRNVGDTNPQVIPEGARVQLDPAVDLDALYGANPTGSARTAKIIAKCLQDYGMVAVEGGPDWKLFAEHDLTADWNPPEMSNGIMSTLGSLVTSSYNPWRVIDFELMPEVDDLSEYVSP